MTAAEMVCHLDDSYQVAMGEKPATSKSSFLQRGLTKWMALYVVVRWPKNVPTMPEVEQGRGGTPPRSFEEDRRRLLATLDRFTHLDRGFRYAPHPIFGRLTARQWMRWGYLHADHHLRQFGR